MLCITRLSQFCPSDWRATRADLTRAGHTAFDTFHVPDSSLSNPATIAWLAAWQAA